MAIRQFCVQLITKSCRILVQRRTFKSLNGPRMIFKLTTFDLRCKALERFSFNNNVYHFSLINNLKETSPSNTGDEDISQCLCRCLECSESDARAILNLCPDLRLLNIELIKEIVTVCKSKGISSAQLLRHPSLLTISKPLLEWKFDLLKSVGINDSTVQLLFLSAVQLKRIAAVWKWDQMNGNDNRLSLFSDLLQCDQIELGNLLLKHHVLLVKDFYQIKLVYSLLKQYCVPPENIRRDLWIFNNNVKLMEVRLAKLKEAGISDIKMWSLRCAEDVFKQFVNRFKTVQDILKPHTNKICYLAEKLQCSPEYIEKELLGKHSLLLKVQLPKLQNMLDLLFGKKFTSEQILKAPRVLCMGVATVENRLKELEKIGKHQLKSLYLLHTTRQRFEKALEKMKQKRNVD